MKFNDVETIENYALDLNKLHEVIKCRNTAEDKSILKQVTLFNNLIMLDTCGNVWVSRRGEGRWTQFSLHHLPHNEDTCPLCGKPFTIHKQDECLYIDGKYYHKNCKYLLDLNTSIRELEEVFNSIYKDWRFELIPSEYYAGSNSLPWFKVTTSDGDIKIGLRKRVTHIEWLSNYKPFAENFTDESVTKCFQDDQRFIHAWTNEKVLEYLKRACSSVIRFPENRGDELI